MIYLGFQNYTNKESSSQSQNNNKPVPDQLKKICQIDENANRVCSHLETANPHWEELLQSVSDFIFSKHCPTVPTTPITAMGCGQCLPLGVER